MAAKKNLEVVQDLPKPDLEDLLASRLAAEVIADVDMGKLTKLAFKHIATNLKAKLIDWLLTSSPCTLATSEIQAIAWAEEEDKAA